MHRKFLAASLLAIAVVTAPSLAFSATGYVSGTVKMRAGPDNGYPIVRTVRSGNGVVIHGCLRDWSWCDVGFSGDRGWLPANRILGDTVKGRVPVVSVGSGGGYDTRTFNLDEYWDTYYNGRFDKRRGHWQGYYQDHRRPAWSDENRQ